MTFLEFVCEELLGPPTSVMGNGESTWPCPACGHARWHTRPHKPGEKDRFACWRCPFWGDEYDILKHVEPDLDFNDRGLRLVALRREYNKVRAEKKKATKKPSCLISRGAAGRKRRDEQLVAELFADLTDAGREVVLLIERSGVPFAALADYCLEFERFSKATAAHHRDRCTDLECDANVCRAARGLPPLTKEELKAERLERKEQDRRRQERVRHALRNVRRNKA